MRNYKVELLLKDGTVVNTTVRANDIENADKKAERKAFCERHDCMDYRIVK